MAGYEYYKTRLEPSIDNKIFIALMYASHLSDRVAAVFTKGGDINYASGVDVFKREEDVDWVEAAAEELTKEHDAEAIFVVRKVWAFSPNVADEEIEDWTKPIYKHPDSLEVFEAALLTRIYIVEWTVTFTTKEKNLIVDEVYLTNEESRFDDRFKKLDNGDEKKLAKTVNSKEKGKIAGFIGPKSID